MTEIAATWVRPQPGRKDLRADIGLAVLLAFAALTTSLLYQRTGLVPEAAPPWLWGLGLGLSTLPLALRRRYPIPVMVVVAVGFFICGQFAVPEILIVNISLFIAFYTVGAWETRRTAGAIARLAVTAGVMAWLVLSLIISSSDVDAFPGLSRSGLFSAYATFTVIQIITNLLYFGGAYFFGERSWNAARVQARLEAQGRELDIERQTSAAQAVALDRLSIARELHDVVAHHVSVMGIQAAAARRSLERDPERAAAALEIVETSAHTAVDELRGLVRTLRSPEPESASSTVGMAQVPALVAESQSAGVATTLIVVGDPRPLPMLVDVALYRVVQEALTNVRKHAGRGASAEVRLRFETESIEVEITDNGVLQHLKTRSAAAVGGSGLGLQGMRERIGAVGGELHAGRRAPSDTRPSGGFMVRATVPDAPTFEPHAVAHTAAAYETEREVRVTAPATLTAAAHETVEEVQA